MRIALSQLNLVVGDIPGNTEAVIGALGEASRQNADLVAFPELATTGYPPEDLLLKSTFVDENLDALEKIASATGEMVAIVGFVSRDDGVLGNAAAICRNGAVEAVYVKQSLPNYGVFDERRYFEPGSALCTFDIAGVRCGVSICEDAWTPDGAIAGLKREGARIIVNINASPFHRGKGEERREMLALRADESDAGFCYVNMVGGQDELVFDGQSMALTPSGEVVARAEAFAEGLLVCEFEIDSTGVSSGTGSLAPERGPVGEVYSALELGVRDYARKNGFSGVLVGLSGGVDSALTAAIAADAIGPDAVVGVTMPSRYTSTETRRDAELLADRLRIKMLEIPIEGPFEAYLSALAESFEGREPDVTEENLQARIRGNYLMALSNKFGRLVLTTGNKSEMATGYSTLYGDLAGGFAVIKDVPKTLVYQLCEYRNGGPGDIGPIPQSIIGRPPTAELREGQLDQDSLPPYDELDAILELYVEDDFGTEAIIAAGFDPATVSRVIAMVDRAEYKRRQAPPGIKITRKAFGKDRRLPITNRYVEPIG